MSKARQTMAHIKSCREACGPMRSSAKDPPPTAFQQRPWEGLSRGRGCQAQQGPRQQVGSLEAGSPEERSSEGKRECRDLESQQGSWTLATQGSQGPGTALSMGASPEGPSALQPKQGHRSNTSAPPPTHSKDPSQLHAKISAVSGLARGKREEHPL